MDALHATGILDSPPEAIFDDVARIAALVCQAPISVVNFIDADRQWFKAETGLGVRSLPLDVSICAQIILEPGLTVVPDLREDARFDCNPLVTNGEPSLRFYAGSRVDSPEGLPLGTVCILDHAPRPNGLTEAQRETLSALASHVRTLLELRVKTRALAESELQFKTIANAMPQIVWSARPDGHHDYYNDRWYEFTGAIPGSTDGEQWIEMFHSDDRAQALDRWRRSLRLGEPYELQYRLMDRSGAYRWTLGRALPVRDRDGLIVRWIGTSTDIDETIRLTEQRDLISAELSHRIKNIFTIVNGLIAMAARSDPQNKAFAKGINERIVALSRAHDLIQPRSPALKSPRGAVTIASLAHEIAAPYSSQSAKRITFSGSDLNIDDSAVTPLALVFHELATNAAKYGALSVTDGKVLLTGAIQADRYVVVWQEMGGPSISAAPDGFGFGSKLIRLCVEDQMGGDITRRWMNGGLSVSLTIPLTFLSTGGKRQAPLSDELRGNFSRSHP